MKTLYLCSVLFFATVITVGCPAVRLNLVPVTDPTQRLEFQGFSILPPQGENWFVAPPELRRQQGSDLIVSFLKMLSPPSVTHTIAAVVRGGRVRLSGRSSAEVLQKFAQGYSEPTERHRPVSVKTSLDNTLGADCVRYDGTVEDRGAPVHPGSVYILEFHGFICFHPHLQGQVIHLEYSQRRLQGEQPLSLEAEGEPFLKSLVFIRLPGQSSQ